MSNFRFNEGIQNGCALIAAGSGWKGMLIAGHTPDKDDTWATLAGFEIGAVTGYTPGFGNRLPLSGLAATAVDNANDRAGVTCANPSVANLGVPGGTGAAYLIMGREITNDAGSKAYSAIALNGGSNFVFNGGSFSEAIDARGFFEIGKSTD